MFALRSPVTRTLAVALVGIFLAAGHADARAGRGGFGFGSRGARTFAGAAGHAHRAHACPADPALDDAAAEPRASTSRHGGPNVAQPARPGFFAGRGGFFGGLLGAGLLGMLLGYGMFGGLGGLGSILGLLLQVGAGRDPGAAGDPLVPAAQPAGLRGRFGAGPAAAPRRVPPA